MLSILIPTHDFTCYKLVNDLHKQAEKLGVPYEIIVGEDGSRSQVDIIANHKITDLSHCRHLIRKENVGLAETRNELARAAVYEWIILIDSDAKVEKEDFLQTYLDNVGKADIIIGGLYHPRVNHDPNRTLRFKYEKEADKHRSAKERSIEPYGKFSAFNAMMRRSTFLCILFDKRCKQYGYEDTLFGVESSKRGISILHIDNPLLHNGLDTNEAFLRKSELAMQNLRMLGDIMESGSRIGRTVARIRRYRLLWAMRLFFRLFKKPIRHNLLSENPSLFWFSVYKLGYYSTL